MIEMWMRLGPVQLHRVYGGLNPHHPHGDETHWREAFEQRQYIFPKKEGHPCSSFHPTALNSF